MSFLFSPSRATKLAEAASKKRAERDNQRKQVIESLLGGNFVNFTTDDQAIVALPAFELAKKIQNEELKAVDVMKIYIARALRCGFELNSNAEEFFEEALQQAKAIDELPKSAKSGLLLCGVPISVKDHIAQKGADSTCGLACRLFNPSDSDCIIVSTLRESGAIPFVRSNVPQSLLLPESKNHVWGQALNPWSPNHTPGGSSGGEGALIGAKASVIGIGTDIGGSIRIPSHFCGVFGFKPTPQRVSYQGVSGPRLKSESGQLAIVPAAGPLGRCTEDLSLILRAWLSNPKYFESDLSKPPLPFDLAKYNSFSSISTSRPLRIGYFLNDGFFDSAPACQRAVNMAVEAFKSAGHEVVPFQVPDAQEMVAIFYSILCADGSKGYMEGVEGEEFIDLYANLLRAAKLPDAIRWAITAGLRASGQARPAVVTENTSTLDAYGYFSATHRLKRYTEKFIAAWRSASLDCVISPPTALTAYKHGQSKELTSSVSYTMLYNVVHFPSGVVPITCVNAGEEEKYKMSESQNDLFGQKACLVVEGSAGLPVGVQIATLPWQDELCLAIMKQLETLLPFKHKSAFEEKLFEPFSYQVKNSADQTQKEISANNSTPATEGNSNNK